MSNPILHELAFNFAEIFSAKGCQWFQERQSTYMIIYVKQGEMQLTVGEKQFKASAKEAIYVPAEAKALNFNYIGKPYYGVTLRFRDFPNVYYFDYHTQVVPLSDELCELIEDIPTDIEISKEKIWKFYRFLTYFEPLLTPIKQKYADIVHTAIDYMNEHDNYTLETLARVCCVSVSGFCAIFREVTGHTMLEDKYRIQAYKAEVLLRTTDLSIDEIARKVGFASTQHFYKVFRSRYSNTPEKIRRSPAAINRSLCPKRPRKNNSPTQSLPKE